ncbi:hypothetical protein D3C86_167210 [compost metagenome]
MQAALHAVAGVVDHVIAQIIKAEFVIGTVGDVGVVCRLLRIVIDLRQVDTGRQAEPAVQRAHPLGIALCQVIIDGHHVYAFAGQCIQVGRQRCHQGFTLTRAHFGDFAVVQRHAAYQLHVEVAHLEDTLAGLTANGKCFRQELVDVFALGETLLEFRGLGLQGLIG